MKIYLDMDGTIADLYGQENWLPKLRNEDKNVFKKCKPLITEKKLIADITRTFQAKAEIVILSMTPKDASKEYCEQVKQQKDEWLDEHFPSLKKRIYMPYGQNKNLKNSKNAVLIDDSETIRKNYKGVALAPWWC